MLDKRHSVSVRINKHSLSDGLTLTMNSPHQKEQVFTVHVAWGWLVVLAVLVGASSNSLNNTYPVSCVLFTWLKFQYWVSFLFLQHMIFFGFNIESYNRYNYL
ncbi:uncharacterized protein GGS25DRAFT_125344 [Hypoxylon fragiforme]|uniref:uncharacterized protein n=1 Tax=Hypoxylon fragiforme TaxID=63214 RepID=UPI0020C6E284|nr:uncharacterized protein GGS25DRAFT_125344 [Hypoxylon fragiforme]KAI2612589.1 hypothetical protein GGS25DRAFT_125344 [Hypoxylon fragiforme]